jgi:hypothetical protein
LEKGGWTEGLVAGKRVAAARVSIMGGEDREKREAEMNVGFMILVILVLYLGCWFYWAEI